MCFRSELGSYPKGPGKERIGTNSKKTRGEGEQAGSWPRSSHAGPLGETPFGTGFSEANSSPQALQSPNCQTLMQKSFQKAS